MQIFRSRSFLPIYVLSRLRGTGTKCLELRVIHLISDVSQACSEGQYFSEGLTNRIVVQCWGREDSAIVCVENKGPPEHIALFILNVHDGSRALPWVTGRRDPQSRAAATQCRCLGLQGCDVGGFVSAILVMLFWNHPRPPCFLVAGNRGATRAS